MKNEGRQRRGALVQLWCLEPIVPGPCNRRHLAEWAGQCLQAGDTSDTKTLCEIAPDPARLGSAMTTSKVVSLLPT